MFWHRRHRFTSTYRWFFISTNLLLPGYYWSSSVSVWKVSARPSYPGFSEFIKVIIIIADEQRNGSLVFRHEKTDPALNKPLVTHRKRRRGGGGVHVLVFILQHQAKMWGEVKVSKMCTHTQVHKDVFSFNIALVWRRRVRHWPTRGFFFSALIFWRWKRTKWFCGALI